MKHMSQMNQILSNFARRLAVFGVAGMLPAVICAPSLAQDASNDPADASQDQVAIDTPVLDINDIVTDLDSDDFATREGATHQLDTPLVSVKALLQELARKDLSAEQRKRLERAGYARFERQERAAMGVQFSRSSFLPGAGVTIDHPTDGFDSARVLMAGDVLRSIDGIIVNNQIEARPIIISFEPGDEVTVVVDRAGETKSLQMRLGNFKDLLRAGGTLSSADKRRAWEYRMVRAGVQAQPEPVVAPFDPEQYRRVVGEERRRKSADELRARTQALNESVPDINSYRALNFVRAGSQRVLSDDAATEFEPEAKRFPVKGKNGLGGADMSLEVRRQMRNLDAQIRENNLRLKNAALPDEQRARLETGNRANRMQILNLRAQLRALEEGDKPDAP